MQWLGSNVQHWSSPTAPARKLTQGGDHFIPGPRGAEDYKGLLARPLAKKGGKNSCLSLRPLIAPTVNFLGNQKFHTNVWVQAYPWVWSLDFFGRSFIVKFDGPRD